PTSAEEVECVSARTAHAVAGDALHVALDGGSLLALALLRRLFVELAAAELGENAGLLAGALEAPQGGIEVLILTHSHARHRNLKSLTDKGISSEPPHAAPRHAARGAGDSKRAGQQRQRRSLRGVRQGTTAASVMEQGRISRRARQSWR